MPDLDRTISRMKRVEETIGDPTAYGSGQVLRDAIALLEAYQKASKWIPVTERLPEEKISPMTMDYTEYPCVFDGRAGQREVRYYKFGKGHFWHGSGCIDEYVTHWAEPMPLPEPPKEKEENGDVEEE